MEGRNLLIQIAAGGREHSPVVLPSLPLFRSLRLHMSPHSASLQCPRSLNQRLHNVKITHYRSLHYASSLLPAWQHTGWSTEMMCLRACMYQERKRERREGWIVVHGEVEMMSKDKRARRRQCGGRKMFSKLTDG